MAALDPPGRKARASDGRRTVRRVAALALAAGLTVTLPPASGTAFALPQNPQDRAKEYAELQKRAAKLSKEYRGGLVTLEEAKKAAERAGAEATKVGREYDVARADVARLAAGTYMTGRLDLTSMVSSADPSAAVHDAAVIEHITRNNGRRLENLQVLSAKAEKSQKEADKKLGDVKKEIEDLESQRTRVKKLLAKYKPEVERTQAPTGGGRPDGASGTKSPIIGNSMTARMRTVLVEVDNRFGPFPAIGCMRPGDPQDHGSGQACDFMESSGGRMPSASALAHGDQVSQYLINNASRLGIKYIIWKQRIYDMRSSGGWRQMEDRGSITQNHYDHVHVSVL